MSLKIFNQHISKLGEGPLFWKNHFYWVDIISKQLLRSPMDGSSAEILHSGEASITSIVIGHDKKFYGTSSHGFVAFDEHFNPAPLGNFSINDSNIRFNDGKVAPDGSYWAGTMSLSEDSPTGSLFQLKHNNELQLKLGGITVSNGLCWSKDQQYMYYIDSPTQSIFAFEFDEQHRLVHKKIIKNIASPNIYPDGMTIDTEGNLWIALWNGYGILKIDPVKGEVLDKVRIPCKKVTSCCFGGEDLSKLYITTSSLDMSDEDLREFPDSGKVFIYESESRGLALDLFEP
jgi:sugar lactone lactonase YvrE